MKLFLPLLLIVSCGLVAARQPDTAKSFGNPSAPVTIELFSDFQCPSCRALHMQILPSLMRDFVIPGRAYLVYKEFPLPMHSHSKEAATWAVAAARVGKYEQVADLLFQSQPQWEADGKIWDRISSAFTPAEQKKMQALVKDPSVTGEVDQDILEGQQGNINQTPTMVIIRGAKRYPIGGVMNYNLLRSLLNDFSK